MNDVKMEGVLMRKMYRFFGQRVSEVIPRHLTLALSMSVEREPKAEGRFCEEKWPDKLNLSLSPSPCTEREAN